MNETREVRTVRCKHCNARHPLEKLPPSEGWHYWCPTAQRFYPEKGGDDDGE